QDEYKKIEDQFKDLSKDKKELFNKLNDAEKILNKSVLISNTIINDPRKKLIFELINNNISILLNFIRDKICPSFINPIFQDEKNRISKQIDELNNNIQLKNEEKRRLEDQLNKMTSNIILYFIMLSKSNNINIPSTFYVENLGIGGGIRLPIEGGVVLEDPVEMILEQLEEMAYLLVEVVFTHL
ncbi:MAG: hypothetical protein EBR40_11465, partial [Proteobacteria bacterium]|nr:hypothetical protein [Pseudomonadota bacterium]